MNLSTGLPRAHLVSNSSGQMFQSTVKKMQQQSMAGVRVLLTALETPCPSTGGRAELDGAGTQQVAGPPQAQRGNRSLPLHACYTHGEEMSGGASCSRIPAAARRSTKRSAGKAMPRV